MNTSFRLAAGTALLACAGISAHAADGAAAAPQRIDIVAPRADAAMDAALRHIDEQYRMSDGRRLDVVGSGGDTLRVRYGRRGERELRREGSGRYASRDGLVALRFELDAQGEPSTAHLTIPASWQ